MKLADLPEEKPKTQWEILAGTISTFSLYLRLITDMQNKYVSLMQDAGKANLPNKIDISETNIICDNSGDWIDHKEILQQQGKLPPHIIDEWWYAHVGSLTPDGQKLKMDLYNIPGPQLVDELCRTLTTHKKTVLDTVEMYQGKNTEGYFHVVQMYRHVDKLMKDFQEQYHG